MENIKFFFLNFFDKIAIGLAILLFAFSGFNLFTNLQKDNSVNKIKEYSPVIERNMRLGKPPEMLKANYALRLENIFNDVPTPTDIMVKKYVNVEKPIFTTEYKQDQQEQPQTQKEFEPGDTEIVFKGGTYEKAMILIRKTSQEYVLEQSFIILPGEKIGENKPINSKKQIDFMTGCTLLDIITNAKKTISSNKTVVNLDDKGDFVNTALEPDPYKITTMKITYKNERLGGAIKELFAGSTANIGTITPLLEPAPNTNKDKSIWGVREYIQNAIDKIKK